MVTGTRPKYSRKIAREILTRLTNGESLRAICRTVLVDDSTGQTTHQRSPGDKFPDEGTVRAWVVDDYDGFAAPYFRARDIGIDSIADEILEISDTPQMSSEETIEFAKTADGDSAVEKKTVKTLEMVNHRRLRVDSRKWYVSKLAPKRYGDRIDLYDSNGEKQKIDDTQRAARIAAILSAAVARKKEQEQEQEQNGSDQ